MIGVRAMEVDAEGSQMGGNVHKGWKFIIDLQPKRSGGNRAVFHPSLSGGAPQA